MYASNVGAVVDQLNTKGGGVVDVEFEIKEGPSKGPEREPLWAHGSFRAVSGIDPSKVV